MAAHARLKNEFTEDEKYHNVRHVSDRCVSTNPTLRFGGDPAVLLPSKNLFADPYFVRNCFTHVNKTVRIATIVP